MLTRHPLRVLNVRCSFACCVTGLHAAVDVLHQRGKVVRGNFAWRQQGGCCLPRPYFLKHRGYASCSAWCSETDNDEDEAKASVIYLRCFLDMCTCVVPRVVAFCRRKRAQCSEICFFLWPATSIVSEPYVCIYPSLLCVIIVTFFCRLFVGPTTSKNCGVDDGGGVMSF